MLLNYNVLSDFFYLRYIDINSILTKLNNYINMFYYKININKFDVIYLLSVAYAYILKNEIAVIYYTVFLSNVVHLNNYIVCF